MGGETNAYMDGMCVWVDDENVWMEMSGRSNLVLVIWGSCETGDEHVFDLMILV